MKTNQQIRVPRVRLIDQNGTQVGIKPIQEALDHAKRAGLDLVEVGDQSDPPVCRIMDYSKYCYDQNRKSKQNKKTQKQKQIKIKEIKFKPNISEHDYQYKINHAREFISKNHKVKISCVFRGREIAYKDQGLVLFEKITRDLEDVAAMEAQVKSLGKTFSTVFAPIGKQQNKCLVS